MASHKVDEVIVKVPQGVKTVKIEFSSDAQTENVKGKTFKKKICD